MFKLFNLILEIPTKGCNHTPMEHLIIGLIAILTITFIGVTIWITVTRELRIGRKILKEIRNEEDKKRFKSGYYDKQF